MNYYHSILHEWIFPSDAELKAFVAALTKIKMGNFPMRVEEKPHMTHFGFGPGPLEHGFETHSRTEPNVELYLNPFACDLSLFGPGIDGKRNRKKGRNFVAAKQLADAAIALGRRFGARHSVNTSSVKRWLRQLARMNVQTRQDQRAYAEMGPVSAPGGWAIVLIDMQQHFVDRGINLGMTKHRSERIIPLQCGFLRRISPLRIPVAVVEYTRSGPTNPRIMKCIKANLPWRRVTKTADGAFRGASNLDAVLQEWGADKLILMGANRSACVRDTAEQAVEAGFKIAIADRLFDDYNYATSASINASDGNQKAREFFKTKGSCFPMASHLITHVAASLENAL